MSEEKKPMEPDLNRKLYTMRIDHRNIRIQCANCHRLWHEHGPNALRYSYAWITTAQLYDELRNEYNTRLNAELSGR